MDAAHFFMDPEELALWRGEVKAKLETLSATSNAGVVMSQANAASISALSIKVEALATRLGMAWGMWIFGGTIISNVIVGVIVAWVKSK